MEVMKKVKKIFLVTFILLGIYTHLFSQTWCAPGATWYYDESPPAAPFTYYLKTTYAGDTSINGKQCQKLNEEVFRYDYITHSFSNYFLRAHFTYSNGDTVFVFRSNDFFTLYNFSTQKGDTIIVPNLESCCSGVLNKLYVDSTGTLTINSQTLKFYYATQVYPAPTNGTWKAKIIEKIGPVNNYMFTETYCGVVDCNIGGPFRCYQDNNFPLYSNGNTTSCDYLATEMDEHEIGSKIKVYPNPFDDFITIDNRIGAELKIFNLLGESVFFQKNIQRGTQINLNALPNGIYLLQVQTAKESITKKIIKN